MSESALPGFNVLLEGPTGTGKTYSLGTLVDSGIECFYLGVESGMESLLSYWTDKGKPIPANLHWHKLGAAKADFGTLKKAAEKVNTYNLDSLSKLNDPDRNKYDLFLKLLECLNGFKDQRTGQDFGPVDEWGVDRCIIIDALTGVNNAAIQLVIGGKPVRNQSDWGIAQDQVEKVLRSLCDGCQCHFVLLAHVEREVDPVQGGTKITVGTLGKALAPKIPTMFSDVILTVREGKDFLWSTANAMADLKTRNLPLSDKIKPDFGQIVEKWRSRAYHGGQG